MRLKMFALLLLLVPFVALAQTQSQTSLEEHLTISRLNDRLIDIYVQRSATSQRVPIILMMQGSGCDSLVDPFFQISQGYAAQYARVVVEKIGVHRGDDGKHCSAEYLRYNTVELRISDYLQTMAHFRTAAQWWNGQLYIIGMSEGGLTAGMVAAFAPETKRVAILSYGGGLTMAEARPDAIAAETLKDKKTPAQADAESANAVRTYDEIRKDPTWTKTFDGDTNTYAWWASVLDLRLNNLLPDVTALIYLAQGTADEEMPVRSSRLAAEHLHSLGRTNYLYCEYDGLSHEYSTANGQSKLTEVFLDALDWLTTTPGVRRQPARCMGR
jgi:dienelactone hydrolase